MEILRNIKHIAFLILASMAFSACDSPDAPNCFKKTGALTTITIDDFSDFKKLLIYDNVELEIVEAQEEYFELTYGKNLLPKVVMEQHNDSLSFFNENSCDWTRDFEKPKLKWFTDKTTLNILCLSNGSITSADTLRNDLIIRVENATNEIELKINNNSTTLLSNSSSLFTVAGRSKSLKVRAYFNDGIYNCINLKVNRADILQRGYNDITLNVRDSLIGSIENAGRVLYKGNPGVKFEVRNGGELIHLD